MTVKASAIPPISDDPDRMLITDLKSVVSDLDQTPQKSFSARGMHSIPIGRPLIATLTTNTQVQTVDQ